MWRPRTVFSDFPLASLLPSRKTRRFSDCTGMGRRSGCFFLPAGSTRRARDIALLVNKVKILAVPLDGIGHQYLGCAFSGLRFPAHVALAINEVQVLLVVPFQV